LRKAFFYLIFVCLAFFVGYGGTDWFFRFRKISLPFELFGILTGLALASWTAALASYLNRRNQK